MTLGDPSRERDFESKETATGRFAESTAASKAQSDDLAAHVLALSADVHALNQHLVVNTDLTKTVVDQSEATKLAVTELRAQGDATHATVVKLEQDTAEFLAIFGAMKGGFKVLGWLGVFAKWIATIGGGCALAWALWNKK
jgi:hypothetical protein